MSNNETSNFINLSLPNDAYPERIWLNERDGEHLGITSFDNDTGEVKERNVLIEKIRNLQHKNGRYVFIKFFPGEDYENKGLWGYRSHYHEELFLEIVKAAGLTKSSTTLSKDHVTDDYFGTGLEEIYG